MKNKLKYVGKITIGLLLLTILIPMYFIDRIIMIPLFWMDTKRMSKWIDDSQNVMMSMLRLLVVGTLYAIYSLIQLWI